MISVGSLFSGIGGFELGFEQAGMSTVWQVENNPKRRQLLSLRFPHAKHWDDVATFPPPDSDFDRVDVICGGFPCQDISLCGKGAGINGSRSGLWAEYFRILCHFRPRLAVVENVAAIRSRGLDRVLGDLAAGGFDAEWDCLPAAAFGAFSERDRLFLLAYAKGVDGRSHDLLEACREWGSSLQSRRLSGLAMATRGQQENTRLRCEPGLDRLVRRLPGAMDRLEGIGNSVFPPVAEWLGQRIVEWFNRDGNE